MFYVPVTDIKRPRSFTSFSLYFSLSDSIPQYFILFIHFKTNAQFILTYGALAYE